MQKNVVIVVAGPTASGKSGLALDLAQHFGGVVINADSMQVYKNTPIISAIPSERDKSVVEHCLYEVFDASHEGNVTEWLDLAVKKIRQVWDEEKVPVVVGGTGLYIDNLINGTTPIPETGIDAKKKAKELLEKGLDVAYGELLKVDEASAKKIKPQDTTRIRRALEVFFDTKIPMSEWHKKPMNKKLSEAEFFVIKILPPADELDERIFCRFDQMIEQGALEEVEALREKNLSKNLSAMKALGVPEILSFLNGEVCLNEAVGLAKLHSRQYAKRQRTWFKNKLDADVVVDSVYKNGDKVLKNVINYCEKRFKDIKLK